MVKNPLVNAGDVGSIPGLGRSPGEGNGNLLQYSCLGNPMARDAWWSTVHRVARELGMTETKQKQNLIILSQHFPMIESQNVNKHHLKKRVWGKYDWNTLD